MINLFSLIKIKMLLILIILISLISSVNANFVFDPNIPLVTSEHIRLAAVSISEFNETGMVKIINLQNITYTHEWNKHRYDYNFENYSISIYLGENPNSDFDPIIGAKNMGVTVMFNSWQLDNISNGLKIVYETRFISIGDNPECNVTRGTLNDVGNFTSTACTTSSGITRKLQVDDYYVFCGWVEEHAYVSESSGSTTTYILNPGRWNSTQIMVNPIYMSFEKIVVDSSTSDSFGFFDVLFIIFWIFLGILCLIIYVGTGVALYRRQKYCPRYEKL